MLKFTTITPLDPNSKIENLGKTRPLIELNGKHKLLGGHIKGRNAIITGKALKLAGFSLPCFFEGDITELDKECGNIKMVLPDGEYAISAALNSNGTYLLDLKTIKL